MSARNIGGRIITGQSIAGALVTGKSINDSNGSGSSEFFEDALSRSPLFVHGWNEAGPQSDILDLTGNASNDLLLTNFITNPVYGVAVNSLIGTGVKPGAFEFNDVFVDRAMAVAMPDTGFTFELACRYDTTMAAENELFDMSGGTGFERLRILGNSSTNSERIQCVFRVPGGTDKALISTASYRDQVILVHVVISESNGSAKMYVNGVLESTQLTIGAYTGVITNILGTPGAHPDKLIAFDALYPTPFDQAAVSARMALSGL